ncbi:hypothetical protein [Streptomyces sp. MMBL 11-1]|nr:hypothetical protein [Streptomyces sp. MMBL 11-1]
MLTYDRSPGTSDPRSEEECWADFWRIIGEEAYRIWATKQAAKQAAD